MRLASRWMDDFQNLERFNGQEVTVTYKQSPSAIEQKIDGTFIAEGMIWGINDIYGGYKSSHELTYIEFHHLPCFKTLHSSKDPAGALELALEESRKRYSLVGKL